MKLRSGDTVMVIAGKDAGKESKIAKVFPKDNRVIVEGVATAKRHQRATGEVNTGGIIDKDMPIDASNVMYVHKGKTVRLGYTENKNGQKVRIARPSGEEV